MTEMDTGDSVESEALRAFFYALARAIEDIGEPRLQIRTGDDFMRYLVENLDLIPQTEGLKAASGIHEKALVLRDLLEVSLKYIRDIGYGYGRRN